MHLLAQVAAAVASATVWPRARGRGPGAVRRHQGGGPLLTAPRLGPPPPGPATARSNELN